MSNLTVGSAPKALAVAVSVALALQLVACGPAGPAKSTAQSSSTASSSSGAVAPSGTASQSGGTGTLAPGGTVTVYYYQGQANHDTEIVQMGLDAFPQVFSGGHLQVHLKAIPVDGALALTLTGLVQQASLTSVFVCLCATLPASVVGASSQGYPYVQQQAAPSGAFYYSVGPVTDVSPALQPFTAALASIQSQALARGQQFITTFLGSKFGESTTRALQTYDSLAGKPVLASAGDLQIDEVDFYPMLGWSPRSEYMTQILTVTNPTENDISGLTIPVPPGASDIHTGVSGKTWPPFTGTPLSASADGTVTVSSPMPALQTTQIAMTYDASSPAATAWPTFTWALPFAAKSVNVKLFSYYADQGDSVATGLPARKSDNAFTSWGANDLPAGRSITFRPYTPSRAVLG